MTDTMSFSSYGQSFLVAFYKPGTNLDLAAAEVQRNTDRVTDLPQDVQKPKIFKASDREEDSGVSIPDIARRAFELWQDLPLKAVNSVQFPLFGNIYIRSNIVDVRIMGKS